MTPRSLVTPQRSAWLRTAPPAPATTAVAAGFSTQTLVLGGGIAGLGAAIRCAELGHEACVLEAEEIGFGASGRSGGQLIPGLKHAPSALVRMLGEEIGTRLARFAGEAPTETFRLIERYRIACDAQQNGWLQPATDATNLKTVAARARAWEAFSGVKLPVLDRQAVRALTGSDAFVGGWVDPRGGQVQPLSYTRGLARVATSLGVRAFSHSRASALRLRDGRWSVQANGHEIVAERLLICTNGYGALLGAPYAESFIPASSIMVSTEPLSAALRQEVLPSGLPFSDARRLLNYCRLDPEGRFLIGARGSFGLQEPERGFDGLRRSAVRLFPALAGVRWEDAWGGLFALTTDFLPHVHQPAPNAWMLVGCNGRGMAMMSMASRTLAELATTDGAAGSPLPVTPLPRIPLHAFRRPGLELATLWYRARDRLGW